MRRVLCARATLLFSSFLILSAASRIDNPKNFVAEVYKHFMANSEYTPPDDIYTPRLAKLIRDDRQQAKGEVGCLDFVFWVNGQDWQITQLTITSADDGQGREMVIAKFRNTGEPQEIHFDFRQYSGRWLLDDAHSVVAPPWTLSEILKCRAREKPL